MDHRACDILWCQRASNLHGMPSCMRPCGCKAAGKYA
jgi:hypothetical protein